MFPVAGGRVSTSSRIVTVIVTVTVTAVMMMRPSFGPETVTEVPL